MTREELAGLGFDDESLTREAARLLRETERLPAPGEPDTEAAQFLRGYLYRRLVPIWYAPSA